ncbi:MAG TPA: redoxin family protein [Steroidobacteraceae bacterium]|nr:redoxin family protein [Steroidobacteraceae bacterium]
MRPLVLLLLALCALPGLASTGEERAQAAGAPLLGTPAPRLVVTTIDGERIDLGALYGHRPVYLKFWATWCVPCREQMPHFEHTYETAGSDLAVIAVNAGFNDSLAEIQDYRRAQGLRMPIVLDDGRLGAALRLRVTPQHVVIGRDGRIAYVGHLVNAELEEALRRAARAPAAGAAAGPAAPAVPALALGSRVPARALTTLDGATVELGPRPGAPLVLVFLSPWCESYLESSRPARAAACRRAREEVEALAAGNGGVRWLGIASGLWAGREDLAEYRGAHALRLPLALDESGDLFREFGVREVPVVVVLDAGGRIVRRLAGAGEELQAELGRLAAR